MAGSIAGKIQNPITNPQIQLSKYSGGAPDAKLAVLSISKANPWWWEGDAVLMLPSNYTDLFKTSETGSRIFSHSWGSSIQVPYRGEERDIDNYLYYNDDTLVLFAAGNNGLLYGVSNPSIAKNVLSVAATESMPGGIVSSADYFDQDQANMCCGNDRLKGFCCPTTLRATSILFSPNNIAFFSSRGYTLDNRIKPEIGSVGHIIVSTRSDGNLYTNQCDNITPQGTNKAALVSMSGTSMATPLLAGNAALVRQYYREGFYPNGVRNLNNGFIPSGALLKATILHSGHKTDGPDQYFGYGRAQLSYVLYFSNSSFNLFVQDRVNIKNSETKTFRFTATSFSQFKVTIAWYDPGNSPSSQSVIVNDLDLDLFINGTKYYPGNGIIRDNINTNEVAISNTVNSGDEIFVRVTGRRVIFPTKFAIVMTGNFIQSPDVVRTCNNIDYRDGSACSGFGYCASQDQCLCNPGHSGNQCQDFTCQGIPPTSPNVCKGNGNCVFGNNCDCSNPDQYTGRNCDIPVCFGFSANQTVVCSRAGTCVAPNTCKCSPSPVDLNPDCSQSASVLVKSILIFWLFFTVVCGICFGVSCLGFVVVGFLMTRPRQ